MAVGRRAFDMKRNSHSAPGAGGGANPRSCATRHGRRNLCKVFCGGSSGGRAHAPERRHNRAGWCSNCAMRQTRRQFLEISALGSGALLVSISLPAVARAAAEWRRACRTARVAGRIRTHRSGQPHRHRGARLRDRTGSTHLAAHAHRRRARSALGPGAGRTAAVRHQGRRQAGHVRPALRAAGRRRQHQYFRWLAGIAPGRRADPRAVDHGRRPGLECGCG